MNRLPQIPVAKFIVPEWGDIVDFGIGFYRPTSLYSLRGRAGTTTLCHSRLYSPSKELRIWPLGGPYLVPEFIDPVFAKTNPNRSFSMTENERFGLAFAKTGSLKGLSHEIDFDNIVKT